ncbi:MAG: NAD-dependent epimerase/dehydratase family protein [Candidatus Bathyarchaeia archaeon]
MEDKTVLITGGAGFIGSWLSEALVKKGAFVRVLDNFQSGSEKNLAHIMGSVELMKGDVRDYETVRTAVKGADFIFHLAANASVPNSTKDPEYDFNSNAIGTFNVLKAASDSNKRPIVLYASSAAVYGEAAYVPIDESHSLRPASFYGASKLCGEAYCRAFRNILRTKVVVLRIFNTYGPRQPRYVMYDLLKKLSRDQKNLEVLGTGKQKRDFIYVTDCVNAITSAALNTKALGEVLNIGTGRGVSIEQLVQLVLDKLNLDGKTEVHYTKQSWKGDVQTLVADVSKLRTLLNYEPQVSLENGFSSLLEWFRTAQAS